MSLTDQFVAHPLLFLAAVLFAIPIIWWVLKRLFYDVDGLVEDAKLDALPDWWNLFEGRYWESKWAGAKVSFFIAISAGIIALIFKILLYLFA